MEAPGVVVRGDSPWASPLHIVVKGDQSLRPCGDYRLLNTVTTPSTYAVPNIKDFTARIAGSRLFSSIDLSKAYWQVPVGPLLRPKTVIITPFRTFEFKVMPFGVKNTGSRFQ